MLKLFLPCQIGSARLLHAATFTCKRSLCVALHVDDGPYDHCVCAARHDRQVELKWYWVEARRFVVLCEWCGTIHTCSMIFPWFSHDVPCRFVSCGLVATSSAATSKVYVARMQDEAAANPKGFQDHCWIGWIEWLSDEIAGRLLLLLLVRFFLTFSHRTICECNLSKWWTAIFGRLECRITCSFTCSIWVQFQHCWHNLIEIKAPRQKLLIWTVRSFVSSCVHQLSVALFGDLSWQGSLFPTAGSLRMPRATSRPGDPWQPSRNIQNKMKTVSEIRKISLWYSYDVPMIFLWYSYLAWPRVACYALRWQDVNSGWVGQWAPMGPVICFDGEGTCSALEHGHLSNGGALHRCLSGAFQAKDLWQVEDVEVNRNGGFIWFYMVLWENHGNIWGYPLVNIQKAIENGQMAIEIVDLPIKKGDFP